MIALIERGDRREISMGYTVELDHTPGTTPEGVRYDAIQRKPKINHCGLGPSGWGRHGPKVALRNDSAYCISGTTMAKHRVDGIEYEAGSEAHIQAVDKTIAKLTTERADAAKRAADAEAAAATEKKRADEASDPKAFAKRAAARADLLSKASALKSSPKLTYLKDEAAAAATDDDTIIKDILAEVAPSVDTAGMDHVALMVALRVAFAMATGGAAGNPPPADAPAAPPPAGPALTGDSAMFMRGAPAQPRTDATKPITIEQAKAEAQARAAERWKGN